MLATISELYEVFGEFCDDFAEVTTYAYVHTPPSLGFGSRWSCSSVLSLKSALFCSDRLDRISCWPISLLGSEEISSFGLVYGKVITQLLYIFFNYIPQTGDRRVQRSFSWGTNTTTAIQRMGKVCIGLRNATITCQFSHYTRSCGNDRESKNGDAYLSICHIVGMCHTIIVEQLLGKIVEYVLMPSVWKFQIHRCLSLIRFMSWFGVIIYGNSGVRRFELWSVNCGFVMCYRNIVM